MTGSPTPLTDERYSCHSSLQADEPIWAHATRVDAWLAIGCDQPWGRKALPESDLPKPVKQRLLDFQDSGTNRRVQFIKSNRSWPANEIPMLLARCDRETPVLRRLALTQYEDLLEMDLAALMDEPVPADETAPPTFLICTNGRRDLCCARYGMGVYKSLAELAPNRAWRTTHLGGHRFSPTAILLPFGLHYGRLRPQDADDLLAFTDAGRISLTHLRGHTSFPPPAQAAEHYVRQLERLDGIQDLRLENVDSMEPGRWSVRFELIARSETIELIVTELPNAYQVYKTTGDSERASVAHFEVEKAS
ncbi:MAG: sucrase ferredoxin [Anaerolineales bacterium]